jgi:tripartite-type tricarboxylate transporter receptor subunit TctC
MAMSRLAWACAALLLSIPSAQADAVADFYAGKTIGLYIGFPPGGGYDIYSRVVAPHFSRHIPGNPAVVVHNMDGGVGVRAAAYLAGAAAQDGTALGMFQDGLTLTKVLGGPGDFDPMKFAWIGRIVSTATFVLVWHTAPAQTIEEAKQQALSVAATSRSSSSSYVPLAMNDLIGTKFNIIRGYQGAAPMALALERGEVHVHGGMALEAIQASKQDWIKEKKAKFLFYVGAQRHKDLPDVPGLLDFANNEKSRSIFGLFGGVVDVGRAIVAAPGTPPERVAALRKAFMSMTQDPAFVAEMRQRNLSIEPMAGEELQKIIAASAATPAELVKQAKRYIGP